MQQLRSVIDLREAALLSAVRAEETEKLKVVFFLCCHFRLWC
jgi:hypothetical protein